MTENDYHQTTDGEEGADGSVPANSPENNDDGDSGDEVDHDCRSHMAYRDYEWAADCYLDRYVCSVCDANRFMVFERTQLLDEDGEVIEEYTNTT